MESTCGYCHDKINQGDEILKDLPVEEKERFADASKGLFGDHFAPLMTCESCFNNVKMSYEFKVKVVSKNRELKRSHEILEKINQFVESSMDEITLQTIDGILMIVPVSKHYYIAAYNYYKSLHSPKVLLNQLPIKFASQNHIDFNHQLIFEDEKITETEQKSLFLKSVYGDENEVEMNSNLSDTSSSMNTSHSSSEDFELPTVKLEPNVEIDESNENEKVIMTKKEEEKYVLDNVKENKKPYYHLCLICDRKFRCINVAKAHVRRSHLIKNIKAENSVLTEVEIKFINENIFKKSVNNRTAVTRVTCKICNEMSKDFSTIRTHILMAHMGKKRSEFDVYVMKKKLVKEGNAKGKFQCVICYDNDNPIEFNRKENLMGHLKQHNAKTVRSYANHEKEHCVEPTHEFFDHPLALGIM